MSLSIACVTFLVHDYDDAIAWFTGRLGFTLFEDRPLAPGKRWVVVGPEGGGARLLLARAADPEQSAQVGRQGGGRVCLFLHSTDFAADHARLLAAGVEFLEAPRHEPYGSVAVFADLHGNRWDLLQLKTPSP